MLFPNGRGRHWCRRETWKGGVRHGVERRQTMTMRLRTTNAAPNNYSILRCLPVAIDLGGFRLYGLSRLPPFVQTRGLVRVVPASTRSTRAGRETRTVE